MLENIDNPCYTNYRKRALRFLPHKCAVCGFDADDRILEVHHRDENRENNRLSNLCILCPTCHRGITLGYYILNEDDTLQMITEDGELLDFTIEWRRICS